MSKAPKHKKPIDEVKRVPRVTRGNAFVVNDDLSKFDHKLIVYTTIVDGVTVRQAHWSGRFDGPVSELIDHLIWAIKEYRVEIVTTTESQQAFLLTRLRARLRKEAKKDPENFGKWQVKKVGEYMAIFSLQVFYPMPKLLPRLTQHTKIKGYADWRNMKAARFVLKHRETQATMAWWDVHGPSDIQDGGKWGGSPKQIQIAKRGWPRLGEEIDDAPKHWVKQVVADTNASARDKMFLDFFEKSLGMKSVWRGNLPRQGTHAKTDRVIDQAFTRVNLVKGPKR